MAQHVTGVLDCIKKGNADALHSVNLTEFKNLTAEFGMMYHLYDTFQDHFSHSQKLI